MKLLVGAVVLALAVAVSYAEVTSPVFGYHFKTGIPRAAAIRKQEEALDANRIVNGEVTDISSVPYQVGLVIQVLVIFTSVCGGSLISDRAIITAAHCHNDGSVLGTRFTAVLGSNRIFSGGLRLSSDNIVNHPGWNPNTAANDIAILRVSGVTYSNVIQPIALPTGNNDYNGEFALASGYGITSDGGSIGNNQVLSSVSLRVITNIECFAVFGPAVHDSNICTSGEGGQSTCSGDSGGPLAYTNDGETVLIGVTSYGASAGCTQGFPAAFTRITSYLDWIKQNE